MGDEHAEGGDAGHIGAHRFWHEPPDTLVFCVNGDVREGDVEAYLREMERFAQGKSYIFTMSDVTRMGSMSPEARKVAARPYPKEVRGMAVYGASFGQRVFIMLLSKAFSVLSKAPSTPLGMFETEEEARAWIREQRAAIERSSKGG
jgi:hypothetical protein